MQRKKIKSKSSFNFSIRLMSLSKFLKLTQENNCISNELVVVNIALHFYVAQTMMQILKSLPLLFLVFHRTFYLNQLKDESLRKCLQ